MKKTGILVSLIAVFSLLFAGTAQAATKGENIAFKTVFVSQDTSLTTLPGGIVYGWNRLTSPTRINKQSATVEFLGSVNYVDGSGPFNGFITVTTANGDKLGLSVSGRGMSLAKDSSTADARFSGSITIIGGSGKYKNAQGIGTMTGTRASALGSPVAMKFNLTLK